MRRHYPVGGGGGAIAGRIRIERRRLRNDAGWFSARGVADFGVIGHELRGRGGQVDERQEHYARCARTTIRILGMLGHESWVSRDLAFGPRDPGYWAAAERRIAAANALGMYVKLGIFADAQIVMPNHEDRKALVRDWAAFCREHPGVIGQLANEPYKNGWEQGDGVSDPKLQELAELFGAEVGHRDFYIGDVGDSGGENNEAGNNKMVEKWNVVGAICNGLDVHSSRDQPQEAPPGRYSRPVDHLEGFTDLLPQVKNPDASLDQEEAIGSHPTCDPGRRECRPDAQVAGMAVGQIVYGAYTLHWIPEEAGQAPAEACPGLDPAACAAIARIPAGPDWRYLNDDWPGAPSQGVRFSGAEGKLRHVVNGDRAWSVVYGEGWEIDWVPGWSRTTEYESANVHIWQCARQ